MKAPIKKIRITEKRRQSGEDAILTYTATVNWCEFSERGFRFGYTPDDHHCSWGVATLRHVLPLYGVQRLEVLS